MAMEPACVPVKISDYDSAWDIPSLDFHRDILNVQKEIIKTANNLEWDELLKMLVATINIHEPLCTSETIQQYFQFVSRENDYQYSERYYFHPDKDTKIYLFKTTWKTKMEGAKVTIYFTIEK